LAWAAAYLDHEREFFGGNPFTQGVRANRHDLETVIRFCDEQGMLERSVSVDELFTENMRAT
jgi:hypothetical protein